MKTLLSVKDLSIGIHHSERGLMSAVEKISFDIHPGETVGLLGESGAGKSLTALSVMGLLGETMQVTGGKILFNDSTERSAEKSGENPGESSSVDLLTFSENQMQTIRGKKISMVFQEPFSSLNPLLKVGRQIEETLELHGEKDRKRNKSLVMKLAAKLEFSEAERVLESYPHQLSGGMCQRVMIAMAIIARPKLLIADEPTTALDKNTQDQIISLLKEINRNFGTSILFISHDLSLIKEISSRLIVMYSGRILEEGGSGEIFHNPAHEYTKGLLRSIPNKANKGKDLAAIPGKIPSIEEGRPGGCPFHPRCEKAAAVCAEEFPPEKVLSADHKTRCILGDLQ